MLLAIQELRSTQDEDSAALVRALDDAEYVNALVDNLHQASRLRSGLESGAGDCELGAIVDHLGARFRALGGAHRDDGPGIPADLIDLEAPTFLLDPARQRSRGFGLAITAAAAERLGWSFALERMEPCGTRATLAGPRLPTRTA